MMFLGHWKYISNPGVYQDIDSSKNAINLEQYKVTHLGIQRFKKKSIFLPREANFPQKKLNIVNGRKDLMHSDKA